MYSRPARRSTAVTFLFALCGFLHPQRNEPRHYFSRQARSITRSNFVFVSSELLTLGLVFSRIDMQRRGKN
jgi:hypothetical protein